MLSCSDPALNCGVRNRQLISKEKGPLINTKQCVAPTTSHVKALCCASCVHLLSLAISSYRLIPGPVCGLGIDVGNDTAPGWYMWALRVPCTVPSLVWPSILIIAALCRAAAWLLVTGPPHGAILFFYIIQNKYMLLQNCNNLFTYESLTTVVNQCFFLLFNEPTSSTTDYTLWWTLNIPSPACVWPSPVSPARIPSRQAPSCQREKSAY